MDIKVIGSGSKGNCYVISDGFSDIMLDCGLPYKTILKAIGFAPGKINACLITHSHRDHVKGARDLMRFTEIKVYMSEKEQHAAGLTCRCAVHGRAFDIGTFKILPFSVHHDTPEPLGYCVKSLKTDEKLLYFTDTYYIDYRIPNLTHIICECNYSKSILQRNTESGRIHGALSQRLLSSHMSLEHLIEFFRKNDISGLKQVWLCHLSDINSDEQLFKQEIQKVTGAEVYVC